MVIHTGWQASVAGFGADGTEVDLDPIGPGSWRLTDPHMSSADAVCVVGYVEADDQGFDVIWLRGTQSRGWYGTLDAVIAHAVSIVRSESSSGPARPKRIAHLPPRQSRFLG